MRYCPICEERYDDDVIKFCTKDGTPLLEEKEPSFTTLPSEDLDDEIGQETVITRREDLTDASTKQSERIVIPAVDDLPQQVRPRVAQPYYPPPPPPSTGKTIVLSILGTLAVLGFGAGLFWLLQKEPAANINVNTNMPNVNVNMNANTGFDSNFNFNTNANFVTSTNFNVNTNLNANLRTPTPTATPKPSPSVTPSPSPSPTETATPRPSPSPTRPANVRPATPAPTPRQGPRPPGNSNN